MFLKPGCEQKPENRIYRSNIEALVTKFMTLLVEDDPLQREVMADLLKLEGLEVVECSTAEAAELVIATSGAELLALVTDNALEGSMSGAELAAFAHRMFPDMKIIVVSGDRKPSLPANAYFLRKPFSPATLLNVVCRG